MDLVWLVYLISLLNPIATLFTFILFCAVCSVIVLMIYRGAECSQQSWYSKESNKEQTEKAKWAMGHVKTALFVAIPCMIFLVFLPAPKTAYMMVGAYAAQKVAENQKVQETGSKVLELINQKLDDYIDEGIQEAQAKVSRSVERNSRNKGKE